MLGSIVIFKSQFKAAKIKYRLDILTIPCYNVDNDIITKVVNKMPKVALTVGDICKIKEILAEKQEQENDVAQKEKINELIKKLDEMEIRS